MLVGVHQLSKRRKKEKKFVKENDEVDCESYYIIEINWLRTWKNFTEGGDLPPPIENQKLIGKSGQVKEWLKIAQDYRILNKKIWNFLLEQYGGGPTITRKELDIMSDPMPESFDYLYPNSQEPH